MQIVIFVTVAMVPNYITGVMWWVDLAWPLGLMLIGGYNYHLYPHTQKGMLICGCYFFQGLRMTLGALHLICTKKWKTDKELQRYEYQRIRHEKVHGEKSFTTFHMQKEIFMQAVANFTLLILPCTIVCNDRKAIQYFDFLAFGLWFNAYMFETIADFQKLRFIKDMAKE